MALDPALVVVACGTCPYYQAVNEQQGTCHYGPPGVALVMSPPPVVGGKPGMGTQAMWPPVNVGESCGKHPMFSAKDTFTSLDQRLVGEAEGTG